MAGPSDVIEAVSKLQDHSTSNPASISQKAALAALNAPDDFSKEMACEFQKRRDYAVERLTEMKRIGFVKPKGAFYIFCDISRLGLDSQTLANRLLEEAHVSIIPGKAFGRDDYVRISFAASIEEIKKGMDRLKGWLDKL